MTTKQKLESKIYSLKAMYRLTPEIEGDLWKGINEYAEQAFNAGQETQHYNPDDVDTFEIPKYQTWNDYLNFLSEKIEK